MSDGVQTDGDLLAEANRAKAFGVKLYTIPYTKLVPGEVAVRDLRMPDKIRAGDTFDIHANIFSSRDQTVKCVLKQGEAINGLDGVRKVDLKRGDNDVVFKSKVAYAGDVTYALEVSDIPEDRFKENNHFTQVAAVVGRPTILYVEGNPTRASYLANALTAQEFEVVVVGPREIPTSDLELERYDFIILSDTPAEQVSLMQQDAIERYVTYMGGGFLFAGGESGYGLGGWYHTTIERILPVRMDAEKRHDEPMVAMSLVIDRSGSMTGLPLEMAKEAAKKTADTLQPDDLLEVIIFDDQPTTVVRLTAAKHRARIQGDIARIQAGGGTQIFPALEEAYKSLRSVKAKKKHVILLTDGVAPTNGREVVQEMAHAGITVTVVGLGTSIDETMLGWISNTGMGRFYKVPDPNSLPRIFTSEAELVSKNAAMEEYFQPIQVNPADFLRGIDMRSAPNLHGYVATKMKPPPAQEILTSEISDPILARWHQGLGWTLAWTSDVKNLVGGRVAPVEPVWPVLGAARAGAHAPEEAPAARHARRGRHRDGARARLRRRDRRERQVPERARGEVQGHRAAAWRQDGVPQDAADGAGPLRGGLPAPRVRLVPADRDAPEVPRRRQGWLEARPGRREQRPGHEPLPARVPGVRARHRDARESRADHRRYLEAGGRDGVRPRRGARDLLRGPVAQARARGHRLLLPRSVLPEDPHLRTGRRPHARPSRAAPARSASSPRGGARFVVFDDRTRSPRPPVRPFQPGID